MSTNHIEPSFTIRTHKPGDLGHIVSRHGALYSQEYNYAPEFEAIVARIAAEFIENYDNERERCWIAEKNETFLGCVMLVKHPSRPDTAKLRVLLVEPVARGLGLGKVLVRACIAFAKEAGYSRIVLWTHSDLLAARRLYVAEGFQQVGGDGDGHAAFIAGGCSENWELELSKGQ